MTETAITLYNQTTPALLDSYDKYARSAGMWFGDLLKFNGKTGEWTAGQQGVEVQAGTELAAIIPAMLVGFVRWQDGELIAQEMVPLTPDYDPRPLRASLGDTDRAMWPKGEDGEPEDPWKEGALLPLKNLKTGAEYTYSTSSVGGCRAVKQLVGAYSKQIKAAPETTSGHLPVVQIGARSYQHQDRKRGTIYNPVLEGIDWVHHSQIAEPPVAANPPADPTLFEDHRPAEMKAKQRRKARVGRGFRREGRRGCPRRPSLRKPRVIDIDVAIGALGAIFEAAPEGVVFLTSLGPNGAVRSLMSRESEHIESFLQRHDRPGAGSYFCVGTLRQDAGGRCKNNVGWIVGLHADIDFKDHDSSPGEVLRRVKQTMLPASLIIETGGGLHAYWLFREAEAATTGMVARVEQQLRRLADHVGGDLQCAECARLMRVPGTTNYKREPPLAVRIIEDREAARYDLAELGEWLADARPLLTRRAKPGNGAGTPFGAYVGTAAAPIDIEARLVEMKFQGTGDTSIHRTQVQVTAALLARGHSVDDVVDKVLAATRAAGDPVWDWTKEKRSIRRMAESWLKKHPPSICKEPPRAFHTKDLDKMQFNALKYVVPGYIVEGLTLFAGKPKIGKSWLLLHAAYAVASGGTTLGDIRCEEGDALYAALEDGPRRLQSRMRKLFPLPPRPGRLWFVCEMPRLTEGGLDFIRSWLDGAERPRLVIVDTLAMVRMPNKKELTAYDADYQAVLDLRTLAHERNVAIVLVHHLRKAEADDAYDTISGTLGLTGAPDTVMIIKRDGDSFTLRARGRDLEEVERAVQFDTETCTWSVLGEAAEVRRSAERGAIIAALTESGSEPLGPNQIAAACGMRAANVRKLLTKLKREGTIKAVTYGKYALAR
jgi:AAA domain-containing protein/DNA primase RepB-like protein